MLIKDTQSELGVLPVWQGYITACSHDVFVHLTITNRRDDSRMLEEVRIGHVLKFLPSELPVESKESLVLRTSAQTLKVLGQQLFVIRPNCANTQPHSAV
jgi:hypothetical protein